MLLGLVAWSGAGLARSAWESVASRVRRVVEGPPVPSSDEPQILAGGIIRRVLLLRADTPALSRPDGLVVETIRFRGFFDVYDVWPLSGEPTHYRIGNRRPIGWVGASSVLPWSTRLVAQPADGNLTIANAPDTSDRIEVSIGRSPVPVLAWEEGSVQLAIWRDGEPWSEVERKGWASKSRFSSENWGVLLSRDELLMLMSRMLEGESAEGADTLRVRALLGRLTATRRLRADEVAAVRDVLPDFVFARGGETLAERSNRLARLNERWAPVASWGGLEFAMVPLGDLP